ncbi:SAM-dependent methyltransferase [Allobranchiibius sp. GilTou38]|uniref:SAM-dependent methyltransferase n=1 Tax=Allobranchiibius sp. GilTou38 TaxID=2815210 RepID=UPI001AA194D7|nr:SAM-dependent methyltransferase [Allobranchiibius sp. GilTou38]MBO1766074.1 SAM-dependent methyltransferase [Allobranchiibius sp. GilTou38]
MSWTPWERAWQDALYGERGFYRSTHGPAAHFATSAQGIPGGGAVLARAVVALARVHRARHILDFACGRGELLTQLSALAPDLTLTGVDVVDRPADLPQDAAWVAGPGGAQVPPGLHGLSDVLVLAHEWLDVVPCPVLQHDGRRLRVVEIDQHGVERLGAPASAADQRWCEDNWPGWDREHSRIEVGRTRDAAYAELRGSVDSGVVVTIDYGHLRDARPDGGTLMGYRDGQACAPRPDGSTDVTAHVAMDTLGAPRLVRQRDLFTALGIRPEAADDALARTDPPAYLRSLALRSAYTALTAPGGLGDFWWSVDPVSRRQDAATAASW